MQAVLLKGNKSSNNIKQHYIDDAPNGIV